NPQQLQQVEWRISFNQPGEMRSVIYHFSSWRDRPDQFYGVQAQSVLPEFVVTDDQPQHDRYSDAPGDARGAGGGTGHPAEEIDEYTLARQHVLIHQDAHRFTTLESAQQPAGKVLFLDGPASAHRAVAIDQGIDQRIVHLTYDEV